jgi:outer membrane receptor protein involved in Fe transport
MALGNPAVVQAQAQAQDGTQGQPSATTLSEAVPSDTAVPDQQDGGQQIVVTGSRIARSGFTAPTPVTVVDSARTQELAITNVADALNQLPSFRASTGPANVHTQGGNVGAKILDLRGLGAPRTLVLVDGRRFVPSTTEGTVDISLIPTILVQRAEVVTGGASAVYGSDAVAGVVNLILDRKMTGFKGEVQSGVSQRGDDANRYLGLAWGAALGERGNLVISGEYEKSEGLAGCYEARDWCAQERSIVGNTPAGTRGQPSSIIASDVHTSTLFTGGVINRSFNAAGTAITATPATDPLRGTKFLPDGTPAPFQYGDFAGALFMIGGDGHGKNAFLSSVLLKVPVERYTAYGSLGYDLTDSVRAFADLSYGRVKGTTLSSTFRDFNGSLMGNIRIDNPYIPDPVRERALAAGVSSFTLGKAAFDFGSPQAVSTNHTYRAVAGLEGAFGNVNWDVYYQYGRNEFHQAISNDPIIANVRRAVDAVQFNGTIVCRVNADANPANDDPACRPINLFGEGLYSPEALDYVIGEGFQQTNTTQHVVAANVGTDLFAITSRPVSIAVGGEWRRNTIAGETDPVSRNLGFWVLNGQAVTGRQSVKEVYGEVLVPLLSGLSLAENLELNAAGRYTDYSTSGGVTTWKIGAVYEPVPGIRFRATRSRDIRAPNINELFGPQQRSTIGLTDPRTGRQANPVVLRGSNLDLSPEVADSFTAGIVLSPQGGFLSQLRLSVDYYDIAVGDAIGLLGAQTLVQRCEDGATEFCGLITRDATDAVIQVNDVLLNANSVQTKGVEVELAYRQPLFADTELNLRVLGTYVHELVTVDSAGATDRAGQTGSRSGTVLGVPDYTIDGVASFTNEGSTLTLHGRYIPPGTYNVAFVGPDDPRYAVTLPTSVNNNRVPGRFYLDLAFTQKVTFGSEDQAEFFFAINNLLDRDPPALPSANLGTNQVLFDPIGRAFRVGVRTRIGG